MWKLLEPLTAVTTVIAAPARSPVQTPRRYPKQLSLRTETDHSYYSHAYNTTHTPLPSGEGGAVAGLPWIQPPKSCGLEEGRLAIWETEPS